MRDVEEDSAAKWVPAMLQEATEKYNRQLEIEKRQNEKVAVKVKIAQEINNLLSP